MKYLYLLLLFTVTVKADRWAVLVAGSNSYWNYRHQADICHAYQILHRDGFPDNRIIVMMYDDIAYNKNNPYPGNIINQPNGPNVYPGVLKDYTGVDVTPENFLAVIKGNKTHMHGIGSGKVLESGPNDHVFIYFADHGGTNLLCFPSDYLYADQLIGALTYMYDHQMYQKLVFYVEACESGSMFNEILSRNINIYVTTAASPFQPSYACYYDEKRQTYLGDVYSVNWLQNSTPKNVSVETLENQYKIDERETNTSHVCQYGNLTMSKLPLDEFLSYDQCSDEWNYQFPPINEMDTVSTYDVKADTLIRRYVAATSKEDREFVLEELQEEFVEREMFDRLFSPIVEYDEKMNTVEDDNNCHTNTRMDHECLRREMKKFKDIYGEFTEYGLKYLRYFAEMCQLE